MALLEVSRLETAYGDSQVLFGLSLTVERGEVVALLGRNGAGKMLVEGIRKAGSDDVDRVRKVLGTVQFEGPTGLTKVRACDHMAMYNFYVGKVKRDPAMPDGLGVGDIKTYHTETVARSCEDIAKVRAEQK